MGLVTEDNSAHSSPKHWFTMIDFLKGQGVKEVFLHLLLTAEIQLSMPQLEF